MDLQAAGMHDPSKIMQAPLVFITLLLSVISAAVAGWIAWRTHRPGYRLTRPRLRRVRLLLAAGGTGTLLTLGSTIAAMTQASYQELLPFSLLLLIVCGVVVTAAAATAGLLQPRIAGAEQSYENYIAYDSFIPDHYPDLMLRTDPADRIDKANPTAQRLLGYRIEELIGQHLTALLRADQREAYHECRKQLIRGIPQQLDVRLQHKAGGWVQLHMMLLPTMRCGRFAGLQTLGKSHTAEYKQQEQVRQTEKLATLGNLAAAVAHEIRNPLTVVRGLVQFNRNRVCTQLHYDLIMGEILQLESIITDFLMLSSAAPELRQRIDFIELVYTAIPEGSPAGGWILTDQCPGDAAWVMADRDKLKRALGRLFAELLALAQSETQPNLLLSRDGSSGICLTIRCPGYAWQLASSPVVRTGEMYYDTKSSGTGLAYMVAYHIITDHGGTMQAFCSDGGERIEIRLQAEWEARSVAL